jgi:4-carboxymuconolactone decarboxylase
MAISETAQQNHDELFPGHVSTLKVTDPELIEIFDNFAFDERLRHSMLDARTRLKAKEIVYQAVPYAGLGKVFDFIHATNDILSERGVQLPLDGQATTTPATRAEKGQAVREQITGADRTEAMHASAADDELHFQQFLSANCFGDYYTRGGIDVRTRELLTFAMLAALGGCDPQVKEHVAANLDVGNNRQLLISVTTALLPFIGYPRTLNALAAINEIAPAAKEGQ